MLKLSNELLYSSSSVRRAMFAEKSLLNSGQPIGSDSQRIRVATVEGSGDATAAVIYTVSHEFGGAETGRLQRYRQSGNKFF